MEKHFLDQLDLKKLMELTIALDSEGDGISIVEKNHHKIISAKVDEETVIIDSEGAIALPIDNITISINSEGKLVATGVKAGKAVAFEDSEGVKTINVVVDAETIKISDDNALFIPIDEKTIFIDSEENIAVNIDNETIQYNESEGYLQVPTYDFNAEHGLYIREESETVLIGAKIDGTTIVLNSEGALSATFQTSTADIPIVVGSEGKIALKYAKPLVVVNSELTVHFDDETIKHDDAKGLYLPLDSETIVLQGDKILVPVDKRTIIVDGVSHLVSVPIDERTIIIDSEDKVSVPIDEKTIIINSEDKLEVPLDSETIILNSEGLVEAVEMVGATHRDYNYMVAYYGHTDETLTLRNITHDKYLLKVGDVIAVQNPVSMPECKDHAVAEILIKPMSDDETMYWSGIDYYRIYLSAAEIAPWKGKNVEALNLTVTYINTRHDGVQEISAKLEDFSANIEDGKKGIVPAPEKLDGDKFLRGDGTWADVPKYYGTDPIRINSNNYISVEYMTGASSEEDGITGVVPTPVIGDQDKYLKGDGTWSEINVFKGVEKIETVAADYELEFMTVSAGTTNELRTRTLDGSFDFSKVKSGETVHFSGAIDIPDTFNNLTLRFLSMYGTGGITAPLDSATVNELKGKSFTELYLKFTSTPVLVSTNNWSCTASLATGYVDGEKGLVPAPTSSEAGYFLNADGTWKALPFADVDNVTIKLDSENKISSTAMINGVQLAGDKNTEELKITWYGTQAEFNKLDSEGKLNEHTLYIINDSEGVAELIHYLDLTDKPKINGIELQGELTSSELSMYTRAEVDEIVNKIRTIIKADALPTTPRRNTTYYIGPNADGKYQVIVIDGLGNQINLGFASGDAKVYTGVDPIKVTDTGTGAARIGLLYDDRYFGIMDTGELRVKLNGRGALRATDDGLNVITYTGGSKDGLVPAASDSEKEFFLKGDGTWKSIDTFEGTNGTTAGKSGLVPAPANTDSTNFLAGDGTWKSVFDLLYPVGSIYMSATESGSTPPGILGAIGTWHKIQDDVTLWSTTALTGNFLDPILPNIEGSMMLADVAGEGERGTGALSYVSEAAGTPTKEYTKGTVEYDPGSVKFSASSYNAIYSGVGDIVRPNAFGVSMWIRTA